MSIAKQILPVACLLLAGCGGGGGSNPPALVASAPSAPLNVTANRGDAAISLGWDTPSSNGGAAIDSYSLVITPTVPAGNVLVFGSHALINNLTNGTGYTVTVRAHNSAGNGPLSTSIVVTPSASSTSLYTPITIQGDTSPSGIFDPSVLRLTTGDLWMSYSSVNYHNVSAQLVQDVGINLAKSTDGGNSFTFEKQIAMPSVATVTDTSLAACGTTTCTGRWVYETSWLIDDATDPKPARRYKLFAHQYFLHPGSSPATFYELGAIVMWTASSPDGVWSPEPTSLLGWNSTPPELTPLRIVNSLSPSLASCIVVAEGGATVTSTGIDFVFTCVRPGTNPLLQDIVLLRTTDHANTFSYVSTLLTASDAAPLPGAIFYTAPSLSTTNGPAPVLIATPSILVAMSSTVSLYQGCVVFPIADPVAGTLFRANGLPIAIAYAQPLSGHFGGACAFDRGLGANGLLLNNVVSGAQISDTQFQILATHLAL